MDAISALLEKYSVLKSLYAEFEEIQKNQKRFSNIPDNLSPFNMEWNVAILLNYKDKDDNVKEFMSRYIQVYNIKLKILLDFLKSGAYQGTDSRFKVYQDRKKLVSIVNQIISKREDFLNSCEIFVKKKKKYLETLRHTETVLTEKMRYK